MKKLLLVLFILSAVAVSAAKGPQFQMLWKSKVPFTPTIHKFTHNGDLSLILCSTKKQLFMMNGKTGQKLWEIDINDNLGVKNAEFQYWSQDAGVIVVFADDKRKSNSYKYFINDRTGVLMWKTDKYVADKGDYNLKNGLKYYYDSGNKTLLMCSDDAIEVVKAATGDVVWSKPYTMEGREKHFDCYYMKYYNLVNVDISKDESIYIDPTNGREVSNIDAYFDFEKYLGDRENVRNLIQVPDKNMFVTLQFKRTWFFGIAKRKMDVIAYEKGTNRKLWSQKVVCNYVYDLYSTYTGQNLPVVDIAYADGKIIVAYEGLSILNADNGKILWETEFYLTDNDKRGNKYEQVVNASPLPVFQDGKAYVFNKKERRLKCFNANTGALIWESEKSARTDYIDGLYVYDDVVLVQLGGVALVNTQTTVQGANNTVYYIYSRGYQLKGDYGLYAFDKNTGSIVWSHKTIKKTIKDPFSIIYGSYFFNNSLFVTTNKSVFCLDPKTGAKVWQTPIKNFKIGAIWRTHMFEDKGVMVFDCKKGVAKIDAATGKILATIKTKNVSGSAPEIGDDAFSDYFIYTAGKNPKFKAFASIDLENGKINGTMPIWSPNWENCFSWDGEYFIVPKGANCSLYKVKP